VRSSIRSAPRTRRGALGQAIVEFTLIAPALLLFVLLTVDVGRAYYQIIDGAGAARAGARMGIISDTSDIGGAIRDEPNTGIPNTNAAWGSVGPTGGYGTCLSAGATCGDPSGCGPGSFAGGQLACFSVRSCNLSASGDQGTCISYGPWGARPLPGGGHGIDIVVVIKFTPATPALPLLLGPSGAIYLTQHSVGDELYF
jgi:hypothetical protein